MLKFLKNDYLFLLLIFFVSVLTVFDLFVNLGRSANMDGIVHTMTPALFSQAVKAGELPVSWVDGFANYGLPLGIIAHQLTTYLTAFIDIFVNNPVLAFNIVAFIGILLSNIFFYLFLRIYFLPQYSFLGAFLFNLAPYRILNLYIRGAMPEFFASIFIPLLLIGVYLIFKKRNIYGFFLLSISVFLISITHPFMFVVSLFLLIPYMIFLLIEESKKMNFFFNNIKLIFFIFAGILIGLGLASYYLVPLNLEIKYFYYGLGKNHLTPNSYLTLQNYLDSWEYFTKLDIIHRGFMVSVGTVEVVGIFLGFFYFIYKIIFKKRKILIFDFALLTGLLILFFTTKYSTVFYQYINILSNIQFQWRMLSAFIFLPPIIFAFLFQKLNKSFLIILLILTVCIVRFPQLYGKNYTVYSNSSYLFTSLNLHAVVMNTIWSGKSEEYPVKKNKVEIIDGKGKVVSSRIRNSSRQYVIDASMPLRLVDYTFYFPGWNVYVDNQKVPIEFQDPKYRGVITYNVPEGRHDVLLKFEDTNVRKLGKLLTVVFSFIFLILFFVRKRLNIFIN